jgi:hypothetical protein
MAFLSFIYRNGIWISIPVFVLSIFLLVQFITGVVRTAKNARLFSVPLIEQQEIEFTETGKVVLCIEGPLFTPTFRTPNYELIGPNGMTVKGRVSLFKARSSGLSQAKMELRVYEIPFPGRYIFKIAGLEGVSQSFLKNHMVFTKPHLAQTVGYVLGLVFAGMLFVGSIVLFFLRVFKVA